MSVISTLYLVLFYFLAYPLMRLVFLAIYILVNDVKYGYIIRNDGSQIKTDSSDFDRGLLAAPILGELVIAGYIIGLLTIGFFIIVDNYLSFVTNKSLRYEDAILLRKIGFFNNIKARKQHKEQLMDIGYLKAYLLENPAAMKAALEEVENLSKKTKA